MDDHLSIRDKSLTEAVTLLRETALFSRFGYSAPLLEKQDIFLVLADCKPVSEVDAGHFVEDSNGHYHGVPDDIQEIQSLLDRLNLRYHLNHQAEYVHVTVSKSQYLVDLYVSGHPDSDYGLLLGFPRSAVGAYQGGTCMPITEQTTHEQEYGIETAYFRCSKWNWAAELELMVQWHSVLKRYGLV